MCEKGRRSIVEQDVTFGVDLDAMRLRIEILHDRFEARFGEAGLTEHRDELEA